MGSLAGAVERRRRARSCIARLRRWCRYRLVVPIKRSRHPPDYTARSVAVGVFWALTPTVGVQMAIVVLHWLVVRRLARRWDFNAIHAMAWTWITNFATVLPAYYVFYVTGQVLLGRWDDLTGYEGFLRLWDATFLAKSVVDPFGGEIGGIATYIDVILKGWGLAMAVGCVPWAILGTWLSYVWSLKLAVAHRRHAAQRRHERYVHMHEGEEGADGGADSGARRAG